MLYVVSYDISDNKRRRLVSKYLLGYGVRVQYSVFEIDMDIREIEKLTKKMKKLIKKDVDSVRIYKLCVACRKDIKNIGIKKGEYYKENFLII